MKRFFLFCFLVIASISFANNVQVGIPSLPTTTTLQFTVQWDNSWRVVSAPNNWDAVWLFVKYQDCANNLWKHVDLSTVAADHSVSGAQLEVVSVSDGKGIYLRLNTNTITNVTSATLTLKFATLVDAAYNYQVFGIEMVNIPQGDFYIGDGTRGTNTYGFSGPNPYPPKLITTAIQTAGLGLNANYSTGGQGSSTALPATFPLGWNTFYCMKYEVSQEQYASFLNTLTYDQQISRTANPANNPVGTLAIAAATNSRNGIRIQTPGALNNIPAIYGNDLNANNIFNEANDGQNIACNWLQWSDLTAYLDWAALRPMTEFEYEKICRGPIAPIPNENAWSATSLLQAHSGALTGNGTSAELSTASGAGLCAYGINSTASDPLRCGFAATALTNRALSGSTYYGVMDMSGNVAEQCVGGYVFNYSGFTAATGDGALSAGGACDIINCPSLGGGQRGALTRGGDWFTIGTATMNVSDRGTMTSNQNSDRDHRFGGRGVR